MKPLIAIVLFPGVELLDFCGPAEVFSVACETVNFPYSICTVAERDSEIVSNGVRIRPDFELEKCPPISALLIPGGRGTRNEINNERLVSWVKSHSAGVDLLMSVCTGALILAKAGLLDGVEATTHHNSLQLLAEISPNTRIHHNRRFVVCGKIVTSAGIVAGIDMSLYIVERLCGKLAADEVSAHLEHVRRE